MASDITVKLAVDGEAEFKSALKSVNAQLKEMDSEIKLTNSGMEDLNDAEEQAATLGEQLAQKFELQAQKIEILQEQYDKAVEKQEELRQKWQEAAEAEGESSEAAIRAGNAYNNQTVQVANLGTQLNNAKSALKETAEAQSSLANGQEESNGEGEQSIDIYGQLSDVLSKKLGVNITELGGKFETLTGLSATTAAGIVALAAAAKKFAEITDECVEAGAQYADDMNTLAKKTGVTTETLQELEYASELIDVSLDTFAGALKKTTKAMGEAQDGTDSYVETFDMLGVTWENTDGTLRDSEDVFFDIIEALRGMDNEAERDAAAQQLLGKSASELNPLILTSAETFEELRQEAEDTGYVLSQDMLDALNDVSDAEDRLDSANEALKNRWGSIWAPIKADLINIGTFGVQQITNLVEGIQNLVDKVKGWKENDAFAWLSSVWENALIPGAKIKNAVSTASSLVDVFNTLRGANKETEESNEEVAESEDDVADSGKKVYKTTYKMTVAQQESVEAFDDAHDAMEGIVDACGEAAGSGDELMKVYEEQYAIFEENAGACDDYTQRLAETALQQLKFQATCEQLEESLPAIADNIGGIANALIATDTAASDWADWYNAAFDEVTSGFSELEINTENTMQKWIDTMRANNSVEAAWNSNMATLTECCTNAVEHPILSASDNFKTAVQTMMDGGVETYGQAAEDLASAISSGNYELSEQICSEINTAGTNAYNAAANQFMLVNGLTQEQFAGLISDGAVILEDGGYEWADATSTAVGDMSTAISEGTEEVSGATDSLVEAAGSSALSDTAEQAWTNAGKVLVNYINTGIAAKQNELTTKVKNVIKSASNSAKSTASSGGRNAGYYFGVGFANGINSTSSLVYKTAYNLGLQAVAAAKKATEEQSPSKATYQIGQYFSQGLANGITSLANTVANASSMVASGAVSAASGSVSSSTTNNYSSGYNITINAQPGQNANDIAQAVMQQINGSLIRSKGVRVRA